MQFLKQYNRRFFAGLISALIILSIIIEGALSIREETSIDLSTGEARAELIIWSWKLRTDVQQTKFSKMAKAAGFEPISTTPDWKVDCVKYYFNRVQENLSFHDTIRQLNDLATGWELSNAPNMLRREQAERALTVLKKGKHFNINVAENNTVTLELID